MRLLEEPLLHFLAAGALLFGGYFWVHRGEQREERRRIEITSNQVQQIELEWRARWQRPPTQAELQAEIADELKQEILYREALDLGLDKEDTIVKRRMAQKMDFIAEEISALREPEPGEVEAWFEKNRAQYAPPPLDEIKDGHLVTTLGGSPFEVTLYKMGDKYVAARSNEFGFANYEIASQAAGRESPDQAQKPPL